MLPFPNISPELIELGPIKIRWYGVMYAVGFLVCLFLAGYGFFRFVVEFFREPDPQLGLFWGIFSMGQALCLAMILGAVILWLVLPKDHTPQARPKP